MPRRKPQSEDQLMNPVEPPITLQNPRTVHRHERPIDAYEAPVGAVVVHEQSIEPVKRKMTTADKAERSAAVSERKMLADRYVRYLDTLAEKEGNQEEALAEIFGLALDAVRMQRIELLDEVHRGRTASRIGEVLERNDLGIVARAARLRQHVYSANAAASLKALDMAGELEGTRQEMGSFEDFLRTAKLAKG